MQISCLVVGAFSLLIKFHVQENEKLIVFAMLPAKCYWSKWSFLQGHSLIIKLNVIRSYHFYLVFEYWEKMINFCYDPRYWYLSFPGNISNQKSMNLHFFCRWFYFYCPKLKTCKSYLFLQNVYLFCWYFHSFDVTVLSFQVNCGNGSVSSISFVKHWIRNNNFMNCNNSFIFCL